MSVRVFFVCILKLINKYIQQGCITLIKSDSKTFQILQTIYISNKELF